jgi:putative (di)nucleoside polyphosphate hydrolase
MTHKPEQFYRRNVGIAVFNRQGQVLLAERADNGAWQMIGTDNVQYLGETELWLRYDYPPEMKNRHLGQEQKWFAVRFLGQDSDIDLRQGPEIEFIDWRWSTLAEAVRLIVDFKRPVYKEMARQFAKFEGTGV